MVLQVYSFIIIYSQYKEFKEEIIQIPIIMKPVRKGLKMVGNSVKAGRSATGNF